ncbi:MAG: A/G-specific adenine glycosylase [Omnitrophica WOR_2 bacterium GWC2_45_7]|nr:MAG: A/G-specific adenine glycosylase [Omnitrophica WOR_2 bacterium GWA2_45_18]OGX18865.1 MAG: A/G-specific adenine glycosylase [Omnitrophica WOR_2 bacterium GWC2_45_7]
MKIKSTFSQSLISWYKKNARSLPWRKTKDPYKIWISEVMLQQTTVNAVIPYYERWVREFPSIADVSQAPLQKILKLWQGLGYYQRAKNIHKSAKIVCDGYAGQLPEEAESLRRLPGFGPYTTGAVLSIAFNKRYPIIDANVRRVIMRVLAIKGCADTTQDKRILEFLHQTMPHRDIGIFNQGLMELGALICRNRQPLCLLCPVKQNCAAYRKGVQEIIPTPKKRNIQDIAAAIGILERNGHYFIQKRPSHGLLADLWEFPGGKLGEGETALQAIRREIKEELGCELEKAEHIMNLRHFYTSFRVHLYVFRCKLKSYPSGDQTHQWVTLKELSNYPMPSGNAKLVARLESENSVERIGLSPGGISKSCR